MKGSRKSNVLSLLHMGTHRRSPSSRSIRASVVFASVLLLSGIVFVPSASAGAPPPVVPPFARVLGRTYGQWSAAQWAWELGAPNNPASQVVNPNPGTAASPTAVDCSIGNRGHVWFLAGTTYAQPFSTAFRSCAIPAGVFLFFPVVDAWADDANCPGFPPLPYTGAELKSFVQQQTDTIVAGSMSVTIDGKTVRGLTDSTTAFRAHANGFSYSVGADNALGTLLCGAPFPAGPVPPTPPGAFADGVYIMVPPLSVGTHHLHWTGAESGAPGSPFFGPASQDISYTIHVSPH